MDFSQTWPHSEIRLFSNCRCSKQVQKCFIYFQQKFLTLQAILSQIILQNMKFHSSSQFETSTLHIIPDKSFAFYNDKSISRSSLESHLRKIRQLQNIFDRSISQKNKLIEQQQQLKRVLQDKLSILKYIFKNKQNQAYDQENQQNIERQKNEKVYQMAQRGQKRLRDCIQHEIHQQNTNRKFYSALNTPKPQLSDKSETFQNSRTEIMQTDEEINKTSAFNIREPTQSNTPNTWYKTPNIKKQRFQQTYLPKNIYQTIQDIWNEPVTKHKKVRPTQLRQSYL